MLNRSFYIIIYHFFLKVFCLLDFLVIEFASLCNPVNTKKKFLLILFKLFLIFISSTSNLLFLKI